LAWEVKVRRLGGQAVLAFHYLALFAIGAATVWSAGIAFYGMALKGGALIHDLLLLFIYLEIGAMVGIYFRTNHMPVRFLIYIAITALTRHVVDGMSDVSTSGLTVIYLTFSILLLALANWMIRHASAKLPSLSVQEAV
jgi:protein PsiE